MATLKRDLLSLTIFKVNSLGFSSLFIGRRGVEERWGVGTGNEPGSSWERNLQLQQLHFCTLSFFFISFCYISNVK